MQTQIQLQDETDLTVYALIIELGVEAVTMEKVAERVSFSRATLYRQYPSWRALVTATHRRTLYQLNGLLPAGGGDRRLELEQWWSAMMTFFFTPCGRAFMALRPHVATRYGMHEVEQVEREMLGGMATWLQAPVAVTRAIWAMALSAGDPRLDRLDRRAMREIVWSLMGPQAPRAESADEPDWSELTALNEPI